MASHLTGVKNAYGTTRKVRNGIAVLGAAALMAAGLAACSTGSEVETSAESGGAVEEHEGHDHADEDIAFTSDGVQIVASLYPLAYLGERVGGEHVNVIDLTPRGAHAHDLELSPKQVVAIGDADLVLYLGDSFQPAVETAVVQEASNSLDGLSVVDEDRLIPGDSHIWLDPTIMADLADAVADKLAEAEPENADEFHANAEQLRAELEEIDGQYREALRECSAQTFVVSHEAFGYIARAYDLQQVGIRGVNPDSEPSPKRISELEKIVKETGATTLFFEAETASDTERKLADSLGLEISHLDTLEAGPALADNYLDALRANLESLQAGMTCAK